MVDVKRSAKERNMSYYEHVFIARPDITEQQVEALTKDYTKIITDGGGKVTKSEYWGLRNTAYVIKKNKKAHYVLLNIDGDHTAITEMERIERINPDILRSMTIRVDELEEDLSVVMQHKSERGAARYDDKKPYDKKPYEKKPYDKGGRS